MDSRVAIACLAVVWLGCKQPSTESRRVSTSTTASESTPRSPAASGSASAATVAGSRVSAGKAALARRPYVMLEPPGVPASEPLPLVLYLHGYGASGSSFLRSMNVRALGADKRFVAVVPDGTPDSRGLRFWNATDGCCNFENAVVDDVAYLMAVLEDVAERRAIDASRIHVVGFSNGGFMAHRLACELGDRIAGIVSIAGAGWKDFSKCRPKGSVAVLQIHGDADPAVPYGGGRTLNRPEAAVHPAAGETVARWASENGCASTPREEAAFDLEPKLAGAETTPLRFGGCKAGAAELWTVHGGNHFVAQSRGAAERYWQFLQAHPKVAR